MTTVIYTHEIVFETFEAMAARRELEMKNENTTEPVDEGHDFSGTTTCKCGEKHPC